MIFIKRSFPFLHSNVRVKMIALAYPLFRQFLVVRIAERIQDLCKIECSGCQKLYRFSSLHPCQKLSWADRVYMFLPQVLTEALEKMEKLIALFHKSYAYPTDNFDVWGTQFVESLAAKDILDRRYINEDTGYMIEYDNSWQDLDDLCNQLVEACEEWDREEGVTPKIAKKKAQPNVRVVDEVERIADQPKKKRLKKSKFYQSKK